MRKQWKKINPEVREKILLESMESGCVIAEIARRYGIRKERIYNWRGQHSKKVETSVKSEAAVNNFVEAKIECSDESQDISSVLKKASLEFTDFTLSIEGSFKVSQMKQIIEVLCST